MKLEYPKALYHRTLPVALVHDPVEHAALGDGWAEEPFPAGDAVAAADVAPPAEPPAAEPPADPPADAAFVTLAAEIVALKAKDAIDLIGSIEQAAALGALATAERNGGARSTVLAAIDARAEALGVTL